MKTKASLGRDRMRPRIGADMEEECYPAISMNGNSKHQQIIHRQGHVTTLLANNGQNRTPTTAADTKPPTFAGMSLLVNGAAAAAAAAAALATNNQQLVAGLTHHNLVSNNNNHLAVNHNLNLKDASMLGLKGLSAMHHHLGGGGGSSSSCHDSSSSSTSASEIDIDETMVKEEPLSPGSSCPSSPLGAGGDGGEGGGGGGGSLRNGYAMATASSYGHSDLVHEHHKNGALQLSPASQSLLKNQQIMVGSNGNNNSNLQGTQVMSKLNIKMEPQSSAGFGLPPTPPSSLPSDESEGNQSPEHHVSPMSPPTDIGTSGSSGTNSASSSRRTSLHGSSSSGTSPSLARVSSASHSAGSSGSGSSPSSSMAARESAGSSSSRQPIHTPLISSQPVRCDRMMRSKASRLNSPLTNVLFSHLQKGSTGTLILTEEEKRTLLAEGYPIPTRLPLTKAEEKSLKKIRRKIKNKVGNGEARRGLHDTPRHPQSANAPSDGFRRLQISAQESRRKKKEYMDQLERRVEILVSENLDYRKRVESLEDSNQNLMAELAKLRQLIGRQAAAAGHRKS
uniref:Uncharacterized protein n=1 Tax=Anopheles albimanus TaxID=7167 RepID=A0A182FTM5_ANOAL